MATDDPASAVSEASKPVIDSRRVLLVLNAQTAWLSDAPTAIPGSKSIRTNIELILNSARNAKNPPLIIHTRNMGEVGEPDEPNTPGWELLLSPLLHEPVIDKLRNNVFAGTNLGELVSNEAEIVVVGLASDYTVKAS
jgi:nicotinamidase-related amidase